MSNSHEKPNLCMRSFCGFYQIMFYVVYLVIQKTANLSQIFPPIKNAS